MVGATLPGEVVEEDDARISPIRAPECRFARFRGLRGLRALRFPFRALSRPSRRFALPDFRFARFRADSRLPRESCCGQILVVDSNFYLRIPSLSVPLAFVACWERSLCADCARSPPSAASLALSARPCATVPRHARREHGRLDTRAIACPSPPAAKEQRFRAPCFHAYCQHRRRIRVRALYSRFWRAFLTPGTGGAWQQRSCSFPRLPPRCV